MLWQKLDNSHLMFLGAFAKLEKETFSFVTSVCPSILMEQLMVVNINSIT